MIAQQKMNPYFREAVGDEIAKGIRGVWGTDIEITWNATLYVPGREYCRWLVDMVRLDGKPPPRKTYAGIIWALMLAGI